MRGIPTRAMAVRIVAENTGASTGWSGFGDFGSAAPLNGDGVIPWQGVIIRVIRDSNTLTRFIVDLQRPGTASFPQTYLMQVTANGVIYPASSAIAFTNTVIGGGTDVVATWEWSGRAGFSNGVSYDVHFT